MTNNVTYNQEHDYTASFQQPPPELGEVIEWVGSNLDPDQIFEDGDLKEWAESNEFIREES